MSRATKGSLSSRAPAKGVAARAHKHYSDSHQRSTQTVEVSEPWMEGAECRAIPVGLLDWFTDDKAEQRKCVEVCDRCPVKADCLTYGQQLDRSGNVYGIFGGRTAKVRIAMRKAARDV